MRKVLMGVVISAVLLAGCSGSDDEPTTGAGADRTSTTADGSSGTDTARPGGGDAEEPGDPVVEPGAVQPPAAWAADFCASFRSFVSSIDDAIAGAGEGIAPDDYEAQQQVLVGFFDLASDEAARVADELEEGGVPDVERGDELVAGLVERFDALSTSIGETSDAVGALAADPETFEAEASGLLATFQEDISSAGTSLTEIDEEYPSEELTTALASACAF